MGQQKNDLTGKTFGRLRALTSEAIYDGKRNRAGWRCVCVCGTEKVVLAQSLTSGKSQSCGCLRVEVTRKTGQRLGTGPKPTHGATVGGKWTPEYNSWAAMNQRCNDPNYRQYAYYGGRGITVHPDWKGPGSFPRFLEHIGPRPEPKKDYSLDRIDPDGNYEPGNVRWATRKQQTANRRG